MGISYPYEIELSVNKVFGTQPVKIKLYSGMTTFVGPNASGKTQTLKVLRDCLKQLLGQNKVRYLSSNRIGDMEQFRSKISQYNYAADDFTFGDLNTKKARLQIETSKGDFFTLDEKKDVFIKVSERLSVLFNRNIFIRWNAGQMKVYFGKTDKEDEYSVTAEASGLVNIISILTALYDDAIEVLLIDEPEVSLHPQLQSFLLREIKNAIKKFNKTVIISTHSPEMIELNKASDLSNFVFFEKDTLPKQISHESPELKNNKLREFIVRMSLIYKEGFFAKKVLLIEGSSDMIVCRYLCNRLNINIDVAGTQIIPVDGKGQFPVIAKLFRLLGKEVCVLTDLDGFIDDNSVIDLFSGLPKAIDLANEKGCESLAEINRGVKRTIDDLVKQYKNELLLFYEQHPYWINRDLGKGDEKAVKRALIAELLSSDEAELNAWEHADEMKQLRTRIISLMGSLEQLGCFVLRKGAIESYYNSSPNTIYDGKPSAAASEVGYWEDKTDELLSENFSDIVRALQYAAIDKEVDEMYAVKKELLCELPLILEVLKNISSDGELKSEIKHTRGNVDSIFEYTIISDDNRKGVSVSLKSKVIDVKGFPFEAYEGDNPNQLINDIMRR